MTIKKQIPTNFNNKLSCEKFIHIDEAPEKRVPQKTASETIVELSTEDGSHPAIKVKLVDLTRLPLYQLTDICTFQSHGMTSSEFIRWFERKKTNINPIHPMAIFYYEKI